MENVNPNIPIRLSVSEAGRIFGVSTKTIRQAIKSNELLYIISRGRYKINFESLLLWSQNSTRRRNLLSTSGIGQYVEKWHIRTKKYSPSKELAKRIIAQTKVKDSNHQSSENQSDL